MPVLQQRRVSTNFRDNALLNVFKVALVGLRYLLDNRADEKLKEQVRRVFLGGGGLEKGTGGVFGARGGGGVSTCWTTGRTKSSRSRWGRTRPRSRGWLSCTHLCFFFLLPSFLFSFLFFSLSSFPFLRVAFFLSSFTFLWVAFPAPSHGQAHLLCHMGEYAVSRSSFTGTVGRQGGGSGHPVPVMLLTLMIAAAAAAAVCVRRGSNLR